MAEPVTVTVGGRTYQRDAEGAWSYAPCVGDRTAHWSVLVATTRALLDALAAAEADTARIDWLARMTGSGCIPIYWGDLRPQLWGWSLDDYTVRDTPDLRAAIDAAMKVPAGGQAP